MSTAANTPQHPDQNADTTNQDQHRDVPSPHTAATPDPAATRDVVRRQKERFGGMKFGACFFGWLTATGPAVLLTALLTAAGAAFGLGQDVTTAQTPANPQAIGLVGGIALLVVVLIAYFAGG